MFLTDNTEGKKCRNRRNNIKERQTFLTFLFLPISFLYNFTLSPYDDSGKSVVLCVESKSKENIFHPGPWLLYWKPHKELNLCPHSLIPLLCKTRTLLLSNLPSLLTMQHKYSKVGPESLIGKC